MSSAWVYVFDLDFTLIQMSSAFFVVDRLFEKGLLTKEDVELFKRVSKIDWWDFFFPMAHTSTLYGLLNNIYVKDVEKIIASNFSKIQFNPKMLALVLKANSELNDVLLLSSTDYYIAKIIAHHIGISKIIANKCEVVNGKYTSNITQSCSGLDKFFLFRKYILANSFSKNKILYYTDSYLDFILKPLVQKIFLVH